MTNCRVFDQCGNQRNHRVPTSK